MTGEQIWNVTDGHSGAGVVLNSRWKQSLQRVTTDLIVVLVVMVVLGCNWS